MKPLEQALREKMQSLAAEAHNRTMALTADRNRIECLACYYKWKAISVYSPLMFECPNCGKMEGVRV